MTDKQDVASEPDFDGAEAWLRMTVSENNLGEDEDQNALDAFLSLRRENAALQAKLKAADHLIVTLTDNSAGFQAERDEARAEAERRLRLIEQYTEELSNAKAEAARLREERDAAVKNDIIRHLRRQREWSEKTFGPGDRAEGVIDHIVKECAEVLHSPQDLSEWIDIAILALDGAWRAGHSPEEIWAALEAKQTKNENREWPDWRTAEPGKAIEHVRRREEKGRGER